MRQVSSHFQGPKRRRRGFCGLQQSAFIWGLGVNRGIPTTPLSGEAVPSIVSPGIGYLSGLLYSAPIGIEVVLGGWEVTVSGEGGRHGGRAGFARIEDRAGINEFWYIIFRKILGI